MMPLFMNLKSGEMRLCKVVNNEFTNSSCTRFEDVITGEVFDSDSGMKPEYNARRQEALQAVWNNKKVFYVMFDVHMYGNRIDANHFAEYGQTVPMKFLSIR